MSASEQTPLLAGIRVVELATMVFAPSAGVILAEFGAEVIKVEPPKGGDLNRGYHRLPGMPISDHAYTFEADNRNKKSITLDIKTSAGKEALIKLIASADIFVTNVRAKSLAPLQLDYDSLHAMHPKLIYAHATAYGEQGEEKDNPGYDTICYFSRSGIETQVFPYEGWLNNFPFGAGDHPSAMTLFAGIMSALYRRQQTGVGSKVSSSLLANGAWANATLLQAQFCNARFQEKRPRENAYSFTSQHYRSRDNRLLKMGIVNIEKDWEAFCSAMERNELANDPRFVTQEQRLANMGLLIKEITDTFAGKDIAYWQHRLQQYDIPHGLVATFVEAANDPQKASNGIVVPLQHPAGEMRTVSSPFELSDYRKTPAHAAPQLGEHTREVLMSIGYNEEDIDNLSS